LRPGAISRAALEAELGVAVAGAAERAAPRVPGSTLAHYAPQTPLRLLDRQRFVSELRAALAAAVSAGERVVVWAQRPPPTDLDSDLRAAVLQWNIAPALAADYGRELYAALRRLDKSGASRILAESVPEGAEWDAARDRLLRAAATFL